MGEFLMSKNTLRKTLLILLTFLILFACACTTETGYEGQLKVVFCLEGGIYQNTTRDIVHYYPFEENQPSLISDPELLSDKKIEKAGYHIEGWYMTKTGEGENAKYSDKWNFSSDKLSQKNLTLYAKWVKNISCLQTERELLKVTIITIFPTMATWECGLSILAKKIIALKLAIKSVKVYSPIS